MNKIIPVLIIFLLIGASTIQAYYGATYKVAFKITKLVNNSKVLPDDEIIKLSKLSDEVNGTKKVGSLLAKSKLPNEVLEDTFMRIAIYQGKISRKDAETMFTYLSGVPGFRSTLRKVIGNNVKGTKGHLNELNIATNASENGFGVAGIGVNFKDGKKVITDIDVILTLNGKTFIIEAKDYLPIININKLTYKADIETLLQYKMYPSSELIRVFTFTNQPTDLKHLMYIKEQARKKDIQLIFGSPSEQVIKLKQLGEIL